MAQVSKIDSKNPDQSAKLTVSAKEFRVIKQKSKRICSAKECIVMTAKEK